MANDTTIEFFFARELELSAWSYAIGQCYRTDIRSRSVLAHQLRKV